jgi:cytochrome c biogenesis protein CcmG, thiol:disulfide interchange protein DsbE
MIRIIQQTLQDSRRWTAVMLAVLLAGSIWSFISRSPVAASTDGASFSSPREGFSAPDFTLDLVGGGQVTLSDLRGKVVLVNLWATWCPPCREEMPAIEAVYKKYKDSGLEVLAVNTTFQDSEGEAAAFAQEFGLSFLIPLDRTGAVSRQYQLRALPTSYFIDRQGIIRSVVVGGPMDDTLIASKVEELLKETP